jgi:hypothetical protein
VNAAAKWVGIPECSSPFLPGFLFARLDEDVCDRSHFSLDLGIKIIVTLHLVLLVSFIRPSHEGGCCKIGVGVGVGEVRTQYNNVSKGIAA